MFPVSDSHRSSAGRTSSTDSGTSSSTAPSTAPDQVRKILFGMDIEATEDKHPRITEIAISTCSVDEPCRDLTSFMANIKIKHFRIKEWLDYMHHNANYNQADAYSGGSEIIDASEIAAALQKEIDQYPEPKEVILVGHAIQNEKRFLHHENITAFDALLERSIDTQQCFMAYKSEIEVTNLGRVASELGVHSGALHNAANDAIATLGFMFALGLDVHTKDRREKEV